MTENENCGLVTSSIAKAMLKVYYSTWDDGVYSFTAMSRYVSDIDFSRFAKDAQIQLHGCNTAKGSIPGNTIAEEFSELLYDAGKTDGYVIGHSAKSNPLINGTKTTNSAQDYRHGPRSIIYNGEAIKEIRVVGALKKSDIAHWIKEAVE